jgi:hypothetical protein
MFSLLSRLTFLIFLLVVPRSDGGLAQTSNDAALLAKNTDFSGIAATAVHDTLSAQNDTVHDRHDASVGRDSAAARKDTLEIIIGTGGLNTVTGFRVQIGSTQDLSDAINERAKAETLLTGYNVYIIYDSPYYKVRAGDFRARYDATQAANFITGHGFPGAWVVPDNVFKDPQKKSR